MNFSRTVFKIMVLVSIVTGSLRLSAMLKKVDLLPYTYQFNRNFSQTFSNMQEKNENQPFIQPIASSDEGMAYKIRPRKQNIKPKEVITVEKPNIESTIQKGKNFSLSDLRNWAELESGIPDIQKSKFPISPRISTDNTNTFSSKNFAGINEPASEQSDQQINLPPNVKLIGRLRPEPKSKQTSTETFESKAKSGPEKQKQKSDEKQKQQTGSQQGSSSRGSNNTKAWWTTFLGIAGGYLGNEAIKTYYRYATERLKLFTRPIDTAKETERKSIKSQEAEFKKKLIAAVETKGPKQELVINKLFNELAEQYSPDEIKTFLMEKYDGNNILYDTLFNTAAENGYAETIDRIADFLGNEFYIPEKFLYINAPETKSTYNAVAKKYITQTVAELRMIDPVTIRYLFDTTQNNAKFDVKTLKKYFNEMYLMMCLQQKYFAPWIIIKNMYGNLKNPFLSEKNKTLLNDSIKFASTIIPAKSTKIAPQIPQEKEIEKE